MEIYFAKSISAKSIWDIKWYFSKGYRSEASQKKSAADETNETFEKFDEEVHTVFKDILGLLSTCNSEFGENADGQMKNYDEIISGHIDVIKKSSRLFFNSQSDKGTESLMTLTLKFNGYYLYRLSYLYWLSIFRAPDSLRSHSPRNRTITARIVFI